MKVFEGYQHGINLGGWLSQRVADTKEHFDTFITEEDVNTLASWGLDHLRLPVDYDTIETDDGEIIEKGYKYIDNCIEWCRKYNLNTVIDLHRTVGYMFDSDVEGDPLIFFKDKGLQDRFITIWKRLATRYEKYSDSVAFELLNEVVSEEVVEAWNEIAHRTMDAIREIAPDTYLIMGGVNYNSVTSVPLLGAPYDDKTIFNFHCYEPLVFTHQKAPWMPTMRKDLTVNYPDDLEYYRELSNQEVPNQKEAMFSPNLKEMGTDFFENLFIPAIKTAEKYDVALYCGEYGCIDQAPVEDSVRWLKDITSVFDKYGIGRAIWTYKVRDFGLTDAHYDSVRKDMIKLL